jgi:acyl CoA:acetate/3-ketoacid CoA transferase alpha subunit
LTIAEVQRVVETGEIDPEVVVTPGIFVDRILSLNDQGREGQAVR